MTAQIIDFALMTKILKNPPNRLREQRKARGLTLTQVAGAIGMNVGYYSKLETGERPLRLDHLRKVAAHYGIDTGELLNAADNPSSLTETERLVLDTMRDDPLFAQSVAAMAEVRTNYRPAPEIVSLDRKQR